MSEVLQKTPEKIMYNIKELQAVLGIGKNLAYRLAQDRNFPKLMINGRYYFPKDKVDKWIDRNQGKNYIVK